MHPPFAAPGARPAQPIKTRNETLPSIQEFLDDLPSINDFVDHRSTDLPPIVNFVAESREHSDVEQPPARHLGEWFQQAEPDSEGWAMTGWQDFDWAGVESLGARTDDAVSARDTFDWTDVPSRSEPLLPTTVRAPTSADEVARALDGLARRIRSGELVIDQLSETPPEAAMVAALAAMLRMRD